MLDLCGAPGGWTQYIAKKIPKTSHIILIDLVRVNLPNLTNVECFSSDITDKKVIDLISNHIKSFSPSSSTVDVVVSDCSPKMSGNYATDHVRQLYLVMHTFRIAVHFQAQALVAKVFDGTDFNDLKTLIKKGYEDFRIYKPPASRNESAELYIIAKRLIEKYVPPEDF